MRDHLIKKLVSSLKCNSCGQNYKEDNIEIMEHRNELWFLKVFCSSCHVRCLVAAIIREEKVEIVSDLKSVERKKFKKAARVSGDDVLDMHNYLSGFDGDFLDLFVNK